MGTLALILAAVLLLEQIGDWWTTARVIARGGRELNPLMRWLIARLGLGGAFAAKGALVGGLGVYASTIPQGWTVLAALVAFYAWVIWHNFRAA